MRLYHRTHSPEGVIERGFHDGEEHMSNGGHFRRGVWFADAPDGGIAGDPTMALLWIEVPDEVAIQYRLEPPPHATYAEYCFPEEVANGFGAPARYTGVETPLALAFGPLPVGAGAIGLLSSDEFTGAAEAFDNALLEATGGRVAIVLAADPQNARQSGRLATAHYKRLGADPVVCDVLRRADARADALPEFDVLFLAGGEPTRLVQTLVETPFWTLALERWHRGSGLAGASAGAMALCTHCLMPESGADKPTVWSSGLGPVEGAGLAVHASSRPAEWLAHIRMTAPVPVVALDDATSVLLRHGAQPLELGPGVARVL